MSIYCLLCSHSHLITLLNCRRIKKNFVARTVPSEIQKLWPLSATNRISMKYYGPLTNSEKRILFRFLLSVLLRTSFIFCPCSLWLGVAESNFLKDINNWKTEPGRRRRLELKCKILIGFWKFVVTKSEEIKMRLIMKRKHRRLATCGKVDVEEIYCIVTKMTKILL